MRNVAEAQAYFRDHWGFQIAWHNTEGRIGAVSHGPCAIFLRETDDAIHPATFWIFAEDVDQAFAELSERGADIVAPITDTPWGLRQFSLRDLSGNIFHFHHDTGD
ncbi:VOC family protein [Roseovarius sp. Pro17]|uniref:VOC family protein n=1 Tax=Roseovarius sp. Pro17 TaxID=3108175 RepID=UPI002D79F0C3|nr:VOC family protein [Roseovarius sp. Pro17]